jgi:hypothetical protein
MKNIDQAIVKHINSLFCSIRWLFSKQNRDGSWGGNLKEKVRWTSNAVYTLSILGFMPERCKRFEQAVEWLKSIPKTHSEWFLRIPALSAAGLEGWLKQNEDYLGARELFQKELIGPLPFKTALALELLSENIEVPNIKLITDAILATLQEEGPDLISFGGSTNNTTLYANFLKRVNGQRYRDSIEKGIRWVMLRRIEESHSEALCWEESYGKTAYVIINLIELTENVNEVRPIILKALNYFRPLETGAIPADRIPAHESQSSIYTTILFIRAIGMLLKHDVACYESAFKTLLMELDLKLNRFRSWIRGFARIAFPTGACLTILILLYNVFGKNFVLSVSASIAAGVIISLYYILRKTIHPSKKGDWDSD